VVLAIFAAAYGLATGEWRPLIYVPVIALFALVIFNLYWLAEDRLERYLPLKPKLSSPPNGKVSVEIACTRHLAGNSPIYIDLNGVRIGKIYRGRSACILLPEGRIRISAYRDKKEAIVEEGIVENGTSLMVWDENSLVSKFHVTFLERDEEFNEEEVTASYKKVRKTLRGMMAANTPTGLVEIVALLLGAV